ncbi:phosphotransferase enzyme family protein [Breznakiella homolactica]|uniref:Aminoglycoside phosphotransferase family protein n=1 Tax=Breznakiella homolactica TaxID=2798577 RepID=A0A7T7XNH7_9SPIR|nr:aminoglycoside phosphotransferase family protein [Breznakiella homolactica]QQO09493.1 aminoglycoside phosphotransferase family protein [Breznakiella homolactica]
MGTDPLSLLYNILDRFALYGDFETAKPYGSGHINSTFMSRWNQAGTRVRYLHQRINESVFVHPDQVMDNIVRVTAHIAEKLTRSEVPGPSRRTLTVIPSKDGKPWVRDDEGGWWRTYLFIEGAHTLELAKSPEEARFLGATIGAFQKQLADLDGPRLHETIPDFHNMEMRYRRFSEAIAKDAHNRVKDVQAEIAFMRENEERGAALIRALRDGLIPERICHNDTKMNNILIDDGSSEGLCVTDLDTVMPGTSLFDMGDLIRTVTTRAEEDERDLSKVEFDLGFLEALMDGYVSAAAEFLTRSERDLLLESGRNITQIMGLRFLTDFLEGDHYYRIARPGHNLDRARNQIALINSMDSKWGEALDLVRDISSRYEKPEDSGSFVTYY